MENGSLIFAAMSTRLLLAATHVSSAHLNEVVPPRVLRDAIVQLCWHSVAEGQSTELPIPADALTGLREILPCFSALADNKWAYQCALKFIGEDGREGLVYLDPIGEFVDGKKTAAPKGVRAEIDVIRVDIPLRQAAVQIVLQGGATLGETPALLTVSLRFGHRREQPEADGGTTSPHSARDDSTTSAPENSRDSSTTRSMSMGSGVELKIPARSQMQLRAEVANHVCSPTSISMLLDFYGKGGDIYEIIGEAQHQPSALYGVWPANIHAASRRGLMGYLLHFPSWQAARHLLDNGIAIVASLCYEEGELSAAAVKRTNGHLVVLRGYREDKVLVNDPAAATDAGVARAYNLREFCRVWLERNAVGYVLFPR